MKICLDGRVIGAALSGIPRLAFNLVTRLIKFGTDHEFVVLMRPGLSDKYVQPGENARVIELNVPPYSVLEQFRIPEVLKELECDLYHCFTYAGPIRQVCRTIVAIHDLIPLEFPEYVGMVRRNYVQHVTGTAARRCWRIITLSNYSKWQICARFGVPAEKVLVVPCAVDPEFFAENNESHGEPETGAPYILNVSNKWLHKNTPAAVRVLDRIRNQCEHKLILVGEQNPEVIDLIRRLGLNGRVVIKENVSDQELIALYRGADVFLFPSLSEGFGLTPLEAMACRVPTVSSYAGSLAEVLEDAAVLVSPYDVEHMAEAVMRILNETDFRNDLIEKGYRRARMFDWDEIAHTILAIYEQASQDS